MHWHTSQHSLIKILFKILDFNPDMIIMYHTVNDLHRILKPGGVVLATFPGITKLDKKIKWYWNLTALSTDFF